LLVLLKQVKKVQLLYCLPKHRATNACADVEAYLHSRLIFELGVDEWLVSLPGDLTSRKEPAILIE